LAAAYAVRAALLTRRAALVTLPAERDGAIAAARAAATRAYTLNPLLRREWEPVVTVPR
jgi:hypothetical protein